MPEKPTFAQLIAASKDGEVKMRHENWKRPEVAGDYATDYAVFTIDNGEVNAVAILFSKENGMKPVEIPAMAIPAEMVGWELIP